MSKCKYSDLLERLAQGNRLTRHDVGVHGDVFAELEAMRYVERDEDEYWVAGELLRLHWGLDEKEE